MLERWAARPYQEAHEIYRVLNPAEVSSQIEPYKEIRAR